MTEARHSSSAIEHLHDIIKRTKADRERVSQMLVGFQRQHAAALTALKNSKQQVEDLTAKLAASSADNDRMSKRMNELEKEVSMMAAAIEVANREIADSDSMLMDAASAVRSNLQAPQAPQQAQQVRPLAAAAAAAAANAPLPTKPAASAQVPEQQTAFQASLLADAPAEAAPSPVNNGVPVSPQLQDDLDRSMADLERMLTDGVIEGLN